MLNVDLSFFVGRCFLQHLNCVRLLEFSLSFIQLYQEDEDDVIAELDLLIEADLEPTIAQDITEDLPAVPDTEPERIEDQLPDVPTKVKA